MPREAGITLGPRVLRKLNARIIHQGEFAAQLGIHYVTISRILTGTLPPSKSMLKKICDALDLDVEVRVVAKVWPKGEKLRGGDSSLEADESESRLI